MKKSAGAEDSQHLQQCSHEHPEVFQFASFESGDAKNNIFDIFSSS